ncbi:alpha/beta hydrolase [Rhodoferax sp. OV413]|uniref:alpha/beta fold hydrolase n=1 Tax=Rhodoferax sp. OV413 TaxID=1855285 RepID=UPI0025FCB1D6|nr:alpha/beta hydrolase [Rhodoferax sp. OV413]
MNTLIFSHANSYPAGTYKVLFGHLRARGFAVQALDKFGHDPRYAVTNNWPHLTQQLVDFVRPLAEAAGGPVWLAGHSMGGFLSLMAAAKHPELARGVVLIDSPLVGGWRSKVVGLAKTTQLVGSVSPGAVSRKRRYQWPDAAAALEHFRHKKMFARWDPQVLQDYINDFPLDGSGKRVLAFERDVETAVYNTLPDNLDKLLKRHPVKCPVTFIGGSHSEELRRVGMDLSAKVSQGRIMMLDGSHLFPMEKPLTTAAAIETALLNMQR